MSTPTSKSSSAPSYDHAYFEQLYRREADPWSVLASPYELAKFRHSIQMLRKPMYQCGLELGCSIGGLTRFLAERCRRLTAIDTSRAALDHARIVCARPHVAFVQSHLPDGIGGGPYDLLVLSEVLYYFTEAALASLASQLRRAINADTEILVVHWTGDTDYPLSGDRAMDAFRQCMGARILQCSRQPGYRLETWIGATCTSEIRPRSAPASRPIAPAQP